VLEPSQDIEVPLGQLGKAGAASDCYPTGAMGLVQLMAQEEIAPAYLRLFGCNRTAYS
jgi:hypothetical protein